MSNRLTKNTPPNKDKDAFLKGQVIMRTKGFCLVLLDRGYEVMCHVKGGFFDGSKSNPQVSVGDEVLIKLSGAQNNGLIVEIMPRRSVFQRQKSFDSSIQTISANIDKVAFLLSLSKPGFSMNLFVRFLVAAILGKAKPILVLNKTDLASKLQIDLIKESLVNIPVDIYLHSIFDKNSNKSLRMALQNNKVLLIGKSGAGKSSLINHIFDEFNLAVAKVSSKTGKGLHTTTLAKLYITSDDCRIIDTPGVKEFRPYIPENINFGLLITKFLNLSNHCRLNNCYHLSEPDCAFKNAVEKNYFSLKFYQSYCKFCLQSLK